MLDSIGSVLQRIRTIESLVQPLQPPQAGQPPNPPAAPVDRPADRRPMATRTAERTFASTLAAEGIPVTRTAARPAVDRPRDAGATLPVRTASTDAPPATPAQDSRWTDILSRASAALAAGAQGPANLANPNPLYAGTYAPEVEARRRSDGSLNPIDLPGTTGLSEAELLTARLAQSVPAEVLATGQNEGVARAGQPQNVNDSYDLLAWVQQLRDMLAGSIPPLVQSNGYVWTPADIANNLGIALDQVSLNKQLYNVRWQERWTMLRQNGYDAIADQEQASVTLANP